MFCLVSDKIFQLFERFRHSTKVIGKRGFTCRQCLQIIHFSC